MKRIFLIACAACVLLSFASCQSSQEEPATESAGYEHIEGLGWRRGGNTQFDRDEYTEAAADPPHYDSLTADPDKYKDVLYQIVGVVDGVEVKGPDSTVKTVTATVTVDSRKWDISMLMIGDYNGIEFAEGDTVAFFGAFSGADRQTLNPSLSVMYAEMVEPYSENDIVYATAAEVFSNSIPEEYNGHRVRVVTDSWMIYNDSLVLHDDSFSGMVYVVTSAQSKVKITDLDKGEVIAVTGKIGSLLNMETDRYFNNAVVEVATAEQIEAAQQ